MIDTTGSATAGTPGATTAAGETGTTAATTATTTTTESWTAAFTNPDTKGFAELRGWKSPEQAVESFRNLEKLQGVPPEQLLKLPASADDKAGWAEVHKRIGFAAPEKADDYGLSALEGFDPSFITGAQASLHKHGVPKDMAMAVMKEMGEQLGALEKDFHTNRQAAFDSDLAKLKAEWGGNFDRLVETGKRAAAEYMPKTGLETADLDAIRDAIGQAKFNKLWAGIGSTMGEAAFHEGTTTTTPASMTPDAARVRLQQLGQDKEWFARYEKGDIKAKQEYANLRQIVANATLAAQ